VNTKPPVVHVVLTRENMDSEVQSENSSDDNSDSDEPEERQMNQVDLEVGLGFGKPPTLDRRQ
jgi:hypothetical protein